jgi:hypothetical protein
MTSWRRRIESRRKTRMATGSEAALGREVGCSTGRMAPRAGEDDAGGNVRDGRRRRRVVRRRDL